MFRDYLIKDGWKFEPSDEKLISKHLKPKTLGEYKGDKEVIGEIDLCKFEPWDLPGLSKLKSDDQVWFFLCPRHFQNNSRRSKRRTKTGQWKPTGQVRSIKDSRTNREIGTKKTLVFHKKAKPKDVKKKDVRTGWTIYEYEYLPEPNLNVQREFVLVRLVKRDERNSYKGDKGHDKISNVKTHAKSDVQNQTIVNQDSHDNQDDHDTQYTHYIRDNQDTHYIHYTRDNQDTHCTQDNQDTQDNLYNQDNQDTQNTQDNQDNQDTHDNQDNHGQYACCFGEESCHTSSEFQAHNWGAPMVNNSADNQGEVSHYMPYFDNTMQFQNELIPNSDVYTMAFDSVNQNPSKSIASSTIESCLPASAFGNKTSTFELKDGWTPYNSYSSDLIGSLFQYQDKEADMSASMESEWFVPMALSSEIGTENPLTNSYMSIHEQRNWHFSTQNPDTNSNRLILEQKNQRSSKATDNENQNKDKNVNVSAPQEREKNSLVAAPLDSESQNASTSDLLVAGGNCWSPLMASLSENDAGGGIGLTEEQSQLLADWEANLEFFFFLNND